MKKSKPQRNIRFYLLGFHSFRRNFVKPAAAIRKLVSATRKQSLDLEHRINIHYDCHYLQLCLCSNFIILYLKNTCFSDSNIM